MSDFEKKINTLPDYSVLMQVYNKVPPEQFEQAARSMLEQSHPPVDFMLICDGELTDEQEKVISKLMEFKTSPGNCCHDRMAEIIRMVEGL